ncbi:MAG: nucleotidyltransferase domain-containing protein [Bacteroidota bacterium]
MATQVPVIALVKKFARDVISEGVHLRKVFLFGSYARGSQRRFSDVDVALVADEFQGFVFSDLDFFIKAKIKKPYSKIQVQTFPTSYFKKGDPFIDEIKRTGIEINLD